MLDSSLLNEKMELNEGNMENDIEKWIKEDLEPNVLIFEERYKNVNMTLHDISKAQFYEYLSIYRTDNKNYEAAIGVVLCAFTLDLIEEIKHFSNILDNQDVIINSLLMYNYIPISTHKSNTASFREASECIIKWSEYLNKKNDKLSLSLLVNHNNYLKFIIEHLELVHINTDEIDTARYWISRELGLYYQRLANVEIFDEKRKLKIIPTENNKRTLYLLYGIITYPVNNIKYAYKAIVQLLYDLNEQGKAFYFLSMYYMKYNTPLNVKCENILCEWFN